VQQQYLHNLSAVAMESLNHTRFGFTVDSTDRANPCARANNHMDWAKIGCGNAMTDKWATRLAGFDAYIWEHCIAMEESLRAD
jgi:hypothetical protein